MRRYSLFASAITLGIFAVGMTAVHSAPPKKKEKKPAVTETRGEKEATSVPEKKDIVPAALPNEAKPTAVSEIPQPAIATLVPPAETDELPKKHYLRGGLIATNTYYMDPYINPGLFSGFYRPFGKYTYDEKWEFNARGLMNVKHYLQPFDSAQGKPSSIKQTNVVGSLEILTAETKFGAHLVTVGRGFYTIEQGILFANFADGAAYNGKFWFGQIRGFAAFSGDYGTAVCSLNVTGCNGDPGPFVNTPNLAPDSGIQNSGRRLFFAAEYYTPEYWGGQLFAYTLISRDLIKEDSAMAKYAYHPWYGGIGARGYVLNSAYRYRADFIYQGGSTYNQVLNGVSEQTNIQAMAALANFSYSLPVLKTIDPQLTADFAIGTGDTDSTRVTNGSQSNTSGNYTAFQNFGSFSGGLALKPRLANLQVYRLGTYFRPFKKYYGWRNLSVQLKYSYYRKSVATGGISDSAATEAASDIGHAGDLAFVFNPMADLQFFWGFGVFKPGSAYPVISYDGTDGQAWRYAHLISLTLIF